MSATARQVPAEDRRTKRRRELHGRIFATARDLFLRQGFEATTVDQIAAAADIAPATFFNHFPSKEEVLREMAGEVFERFRALVAEQRARDVSTSERLLGFAARGARVIEATPELTRRVLLEVLRTTAPPGEANPQLVGVQGDFAAIARAGQLRGEVRDDHDAEFLGAMIGSVVHGVIMRWINDPSYPLATGMRRALEFISEAIEPRSPTSHAN